MTDFDKLSELTTEYVKTKKIVDFSLAENPDVLLKSDTSQIFLIHDDYCSIKKGGYVILDFGEELCGGIRLLTYFCMDSVRIRFGESLSEACSELGEKNSVNAHSDRDFRVFLPNYSDQTFGQTGFRFVRIDNIGERDLKLVSAFAAFSHLKILPSGNFTCNDERVNRIYDAAKRTIFLNMQNNIWDGIKRDRLIWLGDMHPEVLGVLNLYGAHPLVEKSLVTAAKQYPDSWVCGIPSYSVWFIVILCDYVWYSGRWEFAVSLMPYLKNILALIDGSVSKEGKLNYKKSDNYFICWETSEEKGIECANRGLILYALNRLKKLFSFHNVKEPIVDNVIANLLKNRTFDGNSKISATVFGLGYGYDDEKVRRLINSDGGISPFMSGYIARATCDVCNGKKAFADICEFYNAMIEKGATTFWESFDLSWCENSCGIDRLPVDGEKNIHSDFGKYCFDGFRLSLCHGWSCSPVWFFTETVLGVKFVLEGGKKIRIEPDLCGLKSASGYVPTAFGNVFVSHKEVNGKIVTEYKLPDGVELVV